ncbi:MAG: hypothetical protein JNK87_34265 [Bryobacterales bacterium]|nr:hypothetical protein [Bryobacterales bacterium]
MPSSAVPGAPAGTAVLQPLAELWSTQQWHLRFRESSAPPSDLADFQTIAPPRNALWADPFPIEWDGRRFLLFQERVYGFWGRTAGSRGVLRAMEYYGGGRWSHPRTILERAYHLSYPFLFFWQGRPYLLPETQANRTIELYEATEFPWRWRRRRTYMNGVDAVDTTLLDAGGLWWMFTCLENHRSPNRDLHVFSATDPIHGDWRPHACNPVVSNVSCARMAGRIFFDGRNWIRPGQDCSAGFGRSVEFRRILELSPQRYAEEPAGRIGPDTMADASGIHTFNEAGGLQVIDVRRRVERWRLC